MSCVVDGYDSSSLNIDDDIKAYARCIVSKEDKKLKYYSKWSSESGSSDDTQAYATCLSEYFLSGCTAYGASPTTADRVDFDDDTCVAINGDNGDAPRLSISRDKDSSNCTNYFSFGSKSFMNDRSGMLDYCCNKLDMLDLTDDSSDSDNASTMLVFYQLSFLDCINSFMSVTMEVTFKLLDTVTTPIVLVACSMCSFSFGAFLFNQLGSVFSIFVCLVSNSSTVEYKTLTS